MITLPSLILLLLVGQYGTWSRPAQPTKEPTTGPRRYDEDRNRTHPNYVKNKTKESTEQDEEEISLFDSSTNLEFKSNFSVGMKIRGDELLSMIRSIAPFGMKLLQTLEENYKNSELMSVIRTLRGLLDKNNGQLDLMSVIRNVGKFLAHGNGKYRHQTAIKKSFDLVDGKSRQQTEERTSIGNKDIPAMDDFIKDKELNMTEYDVEYVRPDVNCTHENAMFCSGNLTINDLDRYINEQLNGLDLFRENDTVYFAETTISIVTKGNIIYNATYGITIVDGHDNLTALIPDGKRIFDQRTTIDNEDTITAYKGVRREVFSTAKVCPGVRPDVLAIMPDVGDERIRNSHSPLMSCGHQSIMKRK